MSTNKTTNYSLHSWEPGDDFLRSEFNENFSAIDGVLAGAAQMVTGSYVGTGTAGLEINMGFQPKLLIILGQDGVHLIGGPAIGGCFQGRGTGQTVVGGSIEGILTWSQTGFVLRSGNYIPNTKQYAYSYWAFR